MITTRRCATTRTSRVPNSTTQAGASCVVAARCARELTELQPSPSHFASTPMLRASRHLLIGRGPGTRLCASAGAANHQFSGQGDDGAFLDLTIQEADHEVHRGDT